MYRGELTFQFLDIYPFFGFFQADFVGDAEGIMILVLPPVWHLSSEFQSEPGDDMPVGF